MFVTAGAKTHNWRGVVFTRTPVRGRDGKLISTWVAGFCTEYEGKEDTKEFVKERGGTWDSVERFWWVPLTGSNVGEILESFWAVALEGIEAIGEYMQMGGIHISVEADLPQAQRDKIVEHLTKKAKIAQLGLTVVSQPADIKPMPAVCSVVKEEDEDENGVVRSVRYLGTAKGKEEYLYPMPKEDSVFDMDSGTDADGKVWYWLVGERLIGEGFNSPGGWH